MTEPTKRIKIAIWFSVGAEVRYLSHRETLRLWQRTLTRTGAPISFSRGFNPHPRLSLPLPRSVGLSSEAELLVLELDEGYNPDQLREDLGKQLPSGIELKGVQEIPKGAKTSPAWARYHIKLCGLVDRAALNRRVEELLRGQERLIERPRRGRHRERIIDVGGGVKELRQDEEGLLCTIAIEPEGTVRIDELLRVLEINSPRLVSEVTRIEAGYPAELGKMSE